MLVAGGSAALGAASGDAALGAAATGAAGDAAAAAGAAGNAARAAWIKKEPAESVLAYIARGKSLRAVMLNCGVECSEEALAMQLVVGSDECKATVSTLKMSLTSFGCRPTLRTGRRKPQGGSRTPLEGTQDWWRQMGATGLDMLDGQHGIGGSSR